VREGVKPEFRRRRGEARSNLLPPPLLDGPECTFGERRDPLRDAARVLRISSSSSPREVRTVSYPGETPDSERSRPLVRQGTIV